MITSTIITPGNLVKLIDAQQDLSVQVHPDDAYALKHEGSLGKTEFWYVLAARDGAKLVYGFDQNVSERQVRRAIKNGKLDMLLNHVAVQKDDQFYIEAGTVHALGAGCLIAEIQESSNLTYRLYDYDRVGRDGKKRELHVDKAMKVLNFRSSAVPRQPMRVLRYRGGWASELLTRCKHFQVERVLLNTELRRELVRFRTGQSSFHALLCVDGCGSISGEGFMMNFFKGDCVFVPAESIELKLHGKAQLLDVSC
jgi:mannose-6-phosphate isomerase